MKFFMKLVSVVCHPLLMATYLSLALLIKAPEILAIPPQVVWYLVLAIFLTTFLLPALSLLSLKLFSQISSLELINREERPLPFLLIFIWYGISTFLFAVKLQLGKPLSTIIVSVTILIGLLFIITKWFKISIHSTSIWAAGGILSALAITQGLILPDLLFGTILLAGLTSTSRLYLGYHKPGEIWYGAILGFCFCFLSVYFFG